MDVHSTMVLEIQSNFYTKMVEFSIIYAYDLLPQEVLLDIAVVNSLIFVARDTKKDRSDFI